MTTTTGTSMVTIDTSGMLVTENITIGDSNAIHYLKLRGRSGFSSSDKLGGAIEWIKTNTAIAGYTFSQKDNKLVFSDVPQNDETNEGNAWIDFDDGSASFNSTAINGNLNVTGNINVTGCISHSCATGSCTVIGTCV